MVRASIHHGSVAASSPRRHIYRSSPYAMDQRERSLSDGAAVEMNAMPQNTLLDNISIPDSPAFHSSDVGTSGQRSVGDYQSNSASVAFADGNLVPTVCPSLTTIDHCDFATNPSNNPLTTGGHGLSLSELYSAETLPVTGESSPSQRSRAPNFFSDLTFPPLFPPAESTSTALPKLRHQDPRFPNDLYTPRYTRNQGPLREGWCGFCRPGRWLVLKNSAFWYDKCFGHGICATTGATFAPPKETRVARGKNGNVERWEGQCGNCEEWIVLAGGKRSGVPWFRHAYKVGATLKNKCLLSDSADGIQCHTHTKVPSTSTVHRGATSARTPRQVKGMAAQVPTTREQMHDQTPVQHCD